MRSFMLEQNIPYRPPEIPPIGGKGSLVVGLDISLFRCLNVFQGLGRFLVVIERGEQPRFHADVQFLHLLRIQAKVLPAERSYPHQFHLPLENVDSHRQFVQPAAAQLAPPEIDPIIVREFSALLQSFMFQDIGLQILRIGVHRAEFVHADHLPMIAYAVQFDQGPVSRIIVPDRLAELLSQDKVLALVKPLVTTSNPARYMRPSNSTRL